MPGCRLEKVVVIVPRMARGHRCARRRGRGSVLGAGAGLGAAAGGSVTARPPGTRRVDPTRRRAGFAAGFHRTTADSDTSCITATDQRLSPARTTCDGPGGGVAAGDCVVAGGGVGAGVGRPVEAGAVDPGAKLPGGEDAEAPDTLAMVGTSGTVGTRDTAGTWPEAEGAGACAIDGTPPRFRDAVNGWNASGGGVLEGDGARPATTPKETAAAASPKRAAPANRRRRARARTGCAIRIYHLAVIDGHRGTVKRTLRLGPRPSVVRMAERKVNLR